VTLSLDIRSSFAVVTFGRPDPANRLDRRTLDELREGVAALGSDPSMRAIVITGEDRTFSLGWDTALLQEAQHMSGEALRDALSAQSFQFLADSPLPTIAAINGDALSAGLELALACDLRVAARDARLGLPETGSGLIPMGGGTQRLARVAGRAVALEMILCGSSVDAGRAMELGFVSQLAESGEAVDVACALAESIAQRGPLAVRLAREAVSRGLDMSLEQGLRFETDLTVLLQTTADRAEGVQAFKERRSPEFRGN